MTLTASSFALLCAAPVCLAPPAAAQEPPAAASPYALEYYTPPEGEVVEVGGIAFVNDSDVLVSTRRGRVWWVANALADDPKDARWHIFTEGLHEGLGLNVVDGRVYVLQRGELSELIDHDGDRVCDEVRTITQDWGMSGNYHEFAFGLPVDADGSFYLSLNLGFWSPEWWHGMSKARYRGWILKVSPDGEVTPVACGARSPCGLGLTAAGDLFYTDNQGDWMASSPIFHVRQDAFFGHPASLRWTEDYLARGAIPSSTVPPERERTDAAVWLPYAWSRSTGNLVEDATGGRFGPFGGQLFVAELTNGLVLRVQMEQVRGQWQGAAFRFRDEIGSVVRVAFAPDGRTLMCGMTNRGWGGRAPGHGLARLRWSGETPFEMRRVSLRQDGFEIEFTQELSPASMVAFVGAEAELYDYNWWWDYGSPQQRFAPLTIRNTALLADRRTIRMEIDGLEPGRVVRLRLPGVSSADGEPLLHDSFHYTINQMPEGPLSSAKVAKRVAPPAPKGTGSEGWLHLTWGEPFDRWQQNGWRLADANLDPADPRALVTEPGNGALVNDQASGDLVSRQEFGDCEFSFRFMLPEGGDSGLYLQDRYELQLVDDPGQCAGIVGVKGPRVQDAYRGAGQWHEVTGRFFAPRFGADGQKTRNAQFESVAIDGVMVIGAAELDGPTGGGKPGEVARGPLRFQAGAGLACVGDVRVRPLAESAAGGEALLDGEGFDGWQPLSAGDARLAAPAIPAGSFTLRLRARVDGEAEAGLLLRAADGRELPVVLAGPDGGPRLGSLPARPQLADLVPAGTAFELVLQVEAAAGGSTLRLLLNGAELARSVPVPVAPAAGGLEFWSRGAGGLALESLEVIQE